MSGATEISAADPVAVPAARRGRRLPALRRLALMLAVLVPVVAALWLVQGRFVIGFDVQQSRCIPEGVLFLVDRADRGLERNRLVAMISVGNAPYFADGTVMVKRLAGLPGDRVSVSRDHVLVNGHEVARGLDLAKRTKQTVESLEREFVVPAGFVFLLGDTRDSYDGRYYGPVDLTRIAGGARVIF